jgi:hypothetical protein
LLGGGTPLQQFAEFEGEESAFAIDAGERSASEQEIFFGRAMHTKSFSTAAAGTIVGACHSLIFLRKNSDGERKGEVLMAQFL